MKLIKKLVGVATLLLVTANVNAVVTTQLGFVLDASGSVGVSNYNLLRNGLNAAIDTLPLDGSVEITVVRYSSSAGTVVVPTVLTGATIAGIKNAIATHGYTGGGTNTKTGIILATQMMTGSANHDPNMNAVINVATDGSTVDQAGAVQSGADALAAGIDAVTIEAIGSGLSSPTAQQRMIDIAAAGQPGGAVLLALNETNIPSPLNGTSWVVPVSNFQAFEAVVKAKVQTIVINPPPPPPNPVPEPGSMILMLMGLLGLAGMRLKAA